MDKEIAERLVMVSGYLGLSTDYSGRGMYGKTTHGVTGTHQAFFEALAELFGEVVDDAIALQEDSSGDAYDKVEDMTQKLKETLATYKSDNLGMGRIFY